MTKITVTLVTIHMNSDVSSLIIKNAQINEFLLTFVAQQEEFTIVFKNLLQNYIKLSNFKFIKSNFSVSYFRRRQSIV